MHVVCIAGARPNFMKIAPILPALEEEGIRTTLVHTGQHFDHAMSDVFFEELGIRTPDHHLGVGGGTHAQQTGRIMEAFEELAPQLGADLLLTVGDVNSTVACSIVAAKRGMFVAHVEAGLRSRDWSMPEEVNRVLTDRISDLLFAPSQDAVQNLRSEGYREDQIVLAGNVMVDTLLNNLERARARDAAGRLGMDGRYGLITLHRPANVDDPSVLEALVAALNDVAELCPLLFPVHPRTRRNLDTIALSPRIRLIEPLGYLDFLGLQAGAAMVLTDSGGIQEETSVLLVPCLTLRENTERPITVTEGTNQVVGRDRAAIVAAATRVLAGDWPRRRPALWDGQAAHRIAAALSATTLEHHPRPTDVRLADPVLTLG